MFFSLIFFMPKLGYMCSTCLHKVKVVSVSYFTKQLNVFLLCNYCSFLFWRQLKHCIFLKIFLSDFWILSPCRIRHWPLLLFHPSVIPEVFNLLNNFLVGNDNWNDWRMGEGIYSILYHLFILFGTIFDCFCYVLN